MRIYKERRLYFASSCEQCGKRFQSFKRAKIKGGLCRNCRMFKKYWAIEAGQEVLFETEVKPFGMYQVPGSITNLRQIKVKL